MKKKLFVYFLFFLLGACSQLKFHSQNKIAHWGQKHTTPTEYFKIVGVRKFYLWGRYPEAHEVLIDNEIIRAGYREAYDIKIEEFKTWENFFWTLGTLGMLVPQNYMISGKGVKGE